MKLWNNLFSSTLMAMVALLCVASCAVLSESQQKAIKNLSILGSDAAKAPSSIVEKMAEVRMERGFFYTSSLKTEDIHIKELNALEKANESDLKLAEQFDAGVSFLNSYLYALRSLANDNRWDDYGTHIRSAGRNLSSSIAQLNTLNWFEKELSDDVVKTLSNTAASLSESYMRRRQMKFLRDYIRQGDTLVSMCIDSMVTVLKSDRLKELIKNEREGLENNYRVFLSSLPESAVTYQFDKAYISSLRAIDEAEQLRRNCTTSLNAFKRAHSKAVASVVERNDAKELFEELEELSKQIETLWNKISKN